MMVFDLSIFELPLFVLAASADVKKKKKKRERETSLKYRKENERFERDTRGERICKKLSSQPFLSLPQNIEL
jgi:hypothetical protein